MISEILKEKILESKTYEECLEKCDLNETNELNFLILESGYLERDDVGGNWEKAYMYIKEDVEEEQ